MLSTSTLRSEYGPACQEHPQAGAQEAWDAHQQLMRAFGYELDGSETGSRNCRPITGGTGYSLHAYFLAVVITLWNLGRKIPGAVACDFNWNQNPYGSRLVTDMPRPMVDAICAVRTRSGAQVFRWGGYYSGAKDSMHFELVCSASDLATGIDPSTVAGGAPPQEDDDMPALYSLNKAVDYGGVEYDQGFVLMVTAGVRHHVTTDELPLLVGDLGQPKPINPVTFTRLVDATALDMAGERSIPPAQYQQLVADIAKAVKG